MAVAVATCKNTISYYANHELSAIPPSSDITGESTDKAALTEKPYKFQYYLHRDTTYENNGRFLSSWSKPTWLL